MGTRWGGLAVGVFVAVLWTGRISAQESTSKDQDAEAAKKQESNAKDQDLEAIKKRLEALEQEKQQRELEKAAAGDHGADPAEAKWYDRVHVGGGVRASFRAQNDQAPNGRNYSYDFQLDSGRLYTGGKIIDIAGGGSISATLNAEFTGGPSVLDAIAEFHFKDEINVFIGRMLPACDRSDSDGPYYLIAYDYPELSIAFTNAFNGFGRDDGITFWGDIQNFKYWVGAYEGIDRAPGTNVSDHLLYAARLQYDFWDAEKGYYLSSTYHGDKTILALGVAVNYQTDATGPVGDEKNQLNFDVDALFEKKFEFGTPTVEVAYYYYSRGGYGGAGIGGINNGGGAVALGQGQGFLATVAWLIPYKLGWGEFQPFLRYQGFDERHTNATKNPTKNNFDRWDIGTNYVIKGHDARISIVYSTMDRKDGAAVPVNRSLDHLFTVGTQVQF